MTRMVHCVKLHKDAEGLDFPPVPGELGKRIYESVSKEAWEEWKKLQTMIINEYGLNCADPKVRAHVSEQCERYFFGGGIEAVPNHVPLEKNKLGKAVQPATPSLDIW